MPSPSHVAHISSLSSSVNISLPNPNIGLYKSYAAERNILSVSLLVLLCREGEFQNAVVKVALRGGGKMYGVAALADGYMIYLLSPMRLTL
jgi:hypothetical protein